MAVAGDGEQGPAGNLPRNDCLSETRGASFWAQQQTKNLGSRCQYPTPRALSLCISHPDGAGEAGEGRTKAQKDCLVSFLTLPACYTLCQVIFTPSKFEAACCAVKNTIKLNYSAVRSFPPPHLSSFLHLIPEQRKITQQSIRKRENHETSPAGVVDGTAPEHSLGCSGSLPGSCLSPSPSPWSCAPLAPVPGGF